MAIQNLEQAYSGVTVSQYLVYDTLACCNESLI